jgi:hypothetical protein
MTTIHENLQQIDSAARELVRAYDAANHASAMTALRIIDAASKIRAALGVPKEAE